MTFRKIYIYENSETSEVASEHNTLASAMSCLPKPGAEIISNGVILAKAWRGHNYTGDWHLTPDGVERST